MLQIFCQAPQLVPGQGLAFGVLHGDVPHHRFTDVLGALFHALVTRIAQCSSLVTMQQRMRLRDVGDVASGVFKIGSFALC